MSLLSEANLPLSKSIPEILMNRVKSLQPEEIADKIERFDKELCTETFLGELKNLLPNPEQVSHHGNALQGCSSRPLLGWKTQYLPERRCR